MGVFSFFNSNYSYIKRYNEIISVLFKYGFEDLVSYFGKERKYKLVRKLVPKSFYQKSTNLSRWERMRMVCEELGPTYVKFGQIMSSRIDLLPQELITELEKLQDNVPPEPSEIAIKIVEDELEGKISDLFKDFGQKCFASASLAQVHKATLHTGEKVVLKIQRPNIEEKIKADVKVMLYMAELLMERIPSIKEIDVIGLIHSFEKSILRELDFVRESISAQRFKENFSVKETDKKYIKTPSIYQEFTTSKVLTMDFIDGVKVSDFELLDKRHLDKKIIARRFAVSYFKQVFEHGFFHADPHPGNLLAMPENVLCYLDYGMMGNIMPTDLEQFGQLFLSVHSMDVKKIIRSLEGLSENTIIKNRHALEQDLHEFVHTFYIDKTHSNEISTILLGLKDIIVKHKIEVPTHFYLLARSMVTFEGVVHQLDPDLSLEEVVKPYFTSALSKSYSPITFGKKVVSSVYELGNYMEEFPRDLKNAIRKINKGEIKVDITHGGIDPFVHTLNRVSKLIVLALIIASLIIGSTMLIVAKTPPFWKGVSVWGWIGIGLSIFLGFIVLRDISKGDHDDWKGWKSWDN